MAHSAFDVQSPAMGKRFSAKRPKFLNKSDKVIDVEASPRAPEKMLMHDAQRHEVKTRD